jgi:FKBP12-rapamycin complex-associated protein
MTPPPLETVPETAVPGEDTKHVSSEDPTTHTEIGDRDLRASGANDREETTINASDGAGGSASESDPPRPPSASVAPETVYAAASELQRGRVTALDAVEGLNVDANEVLNDRAVSVMRRMSHKLTGRDGAPGSAVAGAAGGRGGRLSPGAESGAAAAAGEDVENAAPDGIDAQVQRLIVAATSHENLCQSYIGWCPFW